MLVLTNEKPPSLTVRLERPVQWSGDNTHGVQWSGGITHGVCFASLHSRTTPANIVQWQFPIALIPVAELGSDIFRLSEENVDAESSTCALDSLPSNQLVLHDTQHNVLVGTTPGSGKHLHSLSLPPFPRHFDRLLFSVQRKQRSR